MSETPRQAAERREREAREAQEAQQRERAPQQSSAPAFDVSAASAASAAAGAAAAVQNPHAPIQILFSEDLTPARIQWIRAYFEGEVDLDPAGRAFLTTTGARSPEDSKRMADERGGHTFRIIQRDVHRVTERGLVVQEGVNLVYSLSSVAAKGVRREFIVTALANLPRFSRAILPAQFPKFHLSLLEPFPGSSRAVIEENRFCEDLGIVLRYLMQYGVSEFKFPRKGVHMRFIDLTQLAMARGIRGGNEVGKVVTIYPGRSCFEDPEQRFSPQTWRAILQGLHDTLVAREVPVGDPIAEVPGDTGEKLMRWSPDGRMGFRCEQGVYVKDMELYRAATGEDVRDKADHPAMQTVDWVTKPREALPGGFFVCPVLGEEGRALVRRPDEGGGSSATAKGHKTG